MARPCPTTHRVGIHMKRGQLSASAGPRMASSSRTRNILAGLESLERRDSPIAPFAITCDLYGWFFHTRYSSSEEEARNDFEQMKEELELIVNLLSQDASNNEQVEHAVLQAISNFVERFPT
jgi:hypothetical protein